ncbi:MAG: PmoA family protein [Opitutales bacterium]
MKLIKFPPHRLSSFVPALAIALAPLFLSAEPSGVTLDHDFEKGQVAVHVRGEHFTTFHYGEEVRTPILWPVHGEGGVTVTRNYPMGEDEPESSDHPHHRSMHLTFGDVNGYDQWHSERIDTTSVETELNQDFAVIRAYNEWLDGDNEPLLKETHELRFYDSPASGRYFDVISTLEAAYEDITFGDDKEGLMAFRIRPEIQGNRAGVLTNAEGEQGEGNVYGTPSRWMDYSGPIEGYGHRGIALFDHPDNFRHPTAWHVRNYGLAAANPFGQSSVAGKDDGSHLLPQGESMTFVYRLYIHSGDVEEAAVAHKYEDFAETSFSR